VSQANQIPTLKGTFPKDCLKHNNTGTHAHHIHEREKPNLPSAHAQEPQQLTDTKAWVSTASTIRRDRPDYTGTYSQFDNFLGVLIPARVANYCSGRIVAVSRKAHSTRTSNRSPTRITHASIFCSGRILDGAMPKKSAFHQNFAIPVPD
jgi:hypothetical protein